MLMLLAGIYFAMLIATVLDAVYGRSLIAWVAAVCTGTIAMLGAPTVCRPRTSSLAAAARTLQQHWPVWSGVDRTVRLFDQPRFRP